MLFIHSNTGLNSDILGDGEYYAFSRPEEKLRLGYLYTTWCNSPYGVYMKFSSVELEKPLPLIATSETQYDKGQLKSFSLDSRNPRLIDDVYNRAMSWLNQMRSELKYPELDNSNGCTAVVIRVNQGVLTGLYTQDEYWEKYHLFYGREE
ncbi:MAG TPA: hypothetical protein V6C85_17400 [Allocoleopsis sp.]